MVLLPHALASASPAFWALRRGEVKPSTQIVAIQLGEVNQSSITSKSAYLLFFLLTLQVKQILGFSLSGRDPNASS